MACQMNPNSMQNWGCVADAFGEHVCAHPLFFFIHKKCSLTFIQNPTVPFSTDTRGSVLMQRWKKYWTTMQTCSQNGTEVGAQTHCAINNKWQPERNGTKKNIEITSTWLPKSIQILCKIEVVSRMRLGSMCVRIHSSSLSMRNAIGHSSKIQRYLFQPTLVALSWCSDGNN